MPTSASWLWMTVARRRRNGSLEVLYTIRAGASLLPERVVDDSKQLRQSVRGLLALDFDSLVLGESQILSQVKQAYELAREGNTAGTLLHAAFQAANRVANALPKINGVSVDIGQPLQGVEDQVADEGEVDDPIDGRAEEAQKAAVVGTYHAFDIPLNLVIQ